MIDGSGSIPLTNGSGSGSRRPKNMWIRWIRNPIRIRIRNTDEKSSNRSDYIPGLGCNRKQMIKEIYKDIHVEWMNLPSKEKEAYIHQSKVSIPSSSVLDP
jgi:hypothetical protein